MHSRIGFILLALVLSGPAAAAERCTELATLAANIAEHKEAGVEQAAVASQLRAQYQSKTAKQRNAAAMTERIVELAYQSEQTPARLYRETKARCEAGEFDERKRK